MDSGHQSKIEFHPGAAARFSELAKELLTSVRSFGPVPQPRSSASQLHPVHHIRAEDIIGELKVRRSSFNLLGVEVGRYWESNGLCVGWEGPEFEKLKELARRIMNADAVRGRVSEKFIVDELFAWLRETLERKRDDELPAFIESRCSSEIKEYEIWVPLFHTYSERDFNIGEITFRTVSKAMLDKAYEHVPQEAAARSDIILSMNRQRSRIQGSLAACIRVTGELKKAKAGGPLKPGFGLSGDVQTS